MTTRQLVILTVVVAGTLSLTWLLPRQLGFQPVGIALRLPEIVGPWWGRDAEVTEKERLTLGEDTQFSRKTYANGSGDLVLTSIVLAGQDMMTGIHRPERCLLAQGWTPSADTSRLVQFEVPEFGKLSATRLRNFRQEAVDAGGTEGAKAIRRESICYYWFVGATEVVPTHERRLVVDLRDRLWKGYNQRWAMVMFSSEITKGYQRFGHDEAQTDALMAGLIKQIAPKILEPQLKRSLAASPAELDIRSLALLGDRL